MFTPREKEIFDITSLTWVHKLDSEYFFRLPVAGGAFKLGLKIYELDIGGFTFVQSHSIKDRYASDEIGEREAHHSSDAALEQAIDGITSSYDAALAAGEQPQAWWFLANPDY